MPNEQYQSLFGASEEVVAATVLDGLGRRRSAPARAAARRLRRRGRGARPRPRRARSRATSSTRSRQARETTDRPTVIFAYTIKGYGLEIAGRPQNHSALLDGEQIDALRASAAASTVENEWDALRAGVAPRRRSSTARRERLDRGDRDLRRRGRRAATLSTATPATTSTQAAFGRIAARPLARRGRWRAARHGRARRLDRRPTSAASSTRPASGARTKSRSTTRWRTRR